MKNAVLITTSLYLLNFTRVKSIGVAFGDVDSFSLDAISKYEEALFQARKEGVRTRALFLCSPHNPLGRYILWVIPIIIINAMIPKVVVIPEKFSLVL